MKKIEIIILSVLFLAAMIFGIAGRNSHTNIMEHNSLENFEVAEISGESFIANLLEVNKSVLDNQKYIVRCEVIGQPEYSFRTIKIKVKIKEVFKGEDISVGDEFYVIKPSWSARPSEQRIDMSFQNLPKEGYDYLLFLDKKQDVSPKKHGIVYSMSSEIIITPCFCYSDDFTRNTLPITAEDGSTYVSYEGVKDNEFFATTQEEMDLLYEFKDWVFETYAGGR